MVQLLGGKMAAASLCIEKVSTMQFPYKKSEEKLEQSRTKNNKWLLQGDNPWGGHVVTTQVPDDVADPGWCHHLAAPSYASTIYVPYGLYVSPCCIPMPLCHRMGHPAILQMSKNHRITESPFFAELRTHPWRRGPKWRWRFKPGRHCLVNGTADLLTLLTVDKKISSNIVSISIWGYEMIGDDMSSE